MAIIPPHNIISDIYNAETAANYYKVFGKDTETNIKTEADEFLISLIPQNLEGKTALDLGSGNGLYSELLAKRGAEKVIAVDLSEAMIKQAAMRKVEKKLDQVEIVKADMNNLPLADHTIDFIFSRFSLMYTDKLPEVTKKLSDALTTDGEAVLEVNAITVQDQQYENDIINKTVPLILSIDDRTVNIANFAYTLQNYTDAFNLAGLKIVTLEQFPADHIIVDPSYAHAGSVSFNWVVFRVIKTLSLNHGES